MSTPETSLTQYKFIDKTKEPNDRVLIEDMYAEQYAVDEARAFQRITEPGAQTLGEDPSAAISTPMKINVDTSPEGLSLAAENARRIPTQQTREKLLNELKEPTLRGAVNTVLDTLSGGIINLDKIDEHLKAEAENKPSPLSEKLKSLGALKLLDPAGNTMEALVREQAKREGLSPEITDKVASSIGTLAGMLSPMTTGRRGAKLGTEILMNSMTSGPQSHVANIASNLLTSTWAIGERFLSAAASAGIYGVSLGTKERSVFFGESGAMLVGGLSAIGDAIKAAGETLRTGKSSLPNIMEDMAVRATQQPERPLFRYGPEGLKQVDRELKDNTILGQGMNFYSTLWRSPTRALGAEDVGFKIINRQMEIYAQAYREAASTGDLSFRNLKNLIENPSSLVEARANQFAIAHTFQRALSELGPNFERFGNIAQSVADISIGEVPLGRLAVPFVRTQTNLMHFTMERTPIINALSSTLRADLLAGGALQAQALGKIGGGATMAAAFMYFVGSGIITGGGPTDPVLRKNKIELEGWRPYSILIGDTYYTYDRLAPLGSMLGIIADMGEMAGSLDSYKLGNLAQAITFVTTHNLTSRSFLTGAADLIAASTGDKAALSRLAIGTISAVTPGMLRAIKKSYDPIQREIDPGADPENGAWAELRKYTNELKSQTPGYSHTLEPTMNLWGDPIEVPKGLGPNWLSPVYQSIKKNDPAGDEIVRLGKLGLASVGRAPRVILGADPDTHPIDQPVSPMDTGIELTDKEYSSFVKKAGNETKIDGIGLHDKLNQLVTSDEKYKNMTDTARGVLITRLVSGYRRAAVGELLKENQGIMDALNSRIQIKGKALSGKESVK